MWIKLTFKLLTINCLAAADPFLMEKVVGIVDFTFLMFAGGNEREMIESD